MFLFIIISSVLLSFSFATSVQASSTVWSKTYGGPHIDWGSCVVETSDGGFAVAGVTNALDEENSAFWLIKTDAYGNMEWNQTYEVTNERTFVYSLIVTSDGGYLLAGSGMLLVSGGTLVKTDALGNFEWSKTYDKICHAVVETSDGGYMLAGSTKPREPSTSGIAIDSGDDEANDFWLAKTDTTGTVQWSKTYGGPEEDVAYELIKTSDGGYALAGYTGGYQNEDVWLVKTDEFGNVEWDKTYETTRSNLPFVIPPFALVETPDGGYTLTVPLGDIHEVDLGLIKTDANGNKEWNQTIGGPDRDWATAMLVTSDGGYIIAGNTESSGAGEFDFWLVRTDASGNLVWKQTYGGPGYDFVYSMVQTTDGEYAVVGRTTSFGAESNDFWLVKTAGCREICEFKTYEFDFSYGYGEYVVVISTNSTVGGFDFGVDQNQISFTVSGPTGTTGAAKIIIPEDLTGDDFPVYLNEFMLLEDVDYTKTYNGTHTVIDMTYSHSTHLIEITGTHITITPETFSWLIPTLMLAAVMLVAVNRKRLSK